MPAQGKFTYEYNYGQSFEELQELPNNGAVGRLRMYQMKQPVFSITVNGENIDYDEAIGYFGSINAIGSIGEVTGLLTNLVVSQVRGTPFANIKATLRMSSVSV